MNEFEPFSQYQCLLDFDPESKKAGVLSPDGLRVFLQKTSSGSNIDALGEDKNKFMTT